MFVYGISPIGTSERLGAVSASFYGLVARRGMSGPSLVGSKAEIYAALSSFRLSKLALPPAAVVSMVSVRSVAKRCR